MLDTPCSIESESVSVKKFSFHLTILCRFSMCTNVNSLVCFSHFSCFNTEFDNILQVFNKFWDTMNSPDKMDLARKVQQRVQEKCPQQFY